MGGHEQNESKKCSSMDDCLDRVRNGHLPGDERHMYENNEHINCMAQRLYENKTVWKVGDNHFNDAHNICVMKHPFYPYEPTITRSIDPTWFRKLEIDPNEKKVILYGADK